MGAWRPRSWPLTLFVARTYGRLLIRSRHLQELLQTAASLPGPESDFPAWDRVAGYAAVLPAGLTPSASATATKGAGGWSSASAKSASTLAHPGPGEIRAAVAACLKGMSRQIEEGLSDALASAPRAWDRADHLLVLLDEPRATEVARLWRRLHAVACAPELSAADRAVAVEGLLAVHTAYELTRLLERKLSSLIRLRVRSGSEDLLPGGRPFLDVAAALEEAASAWAIQ